MYTHTNILIKESLNAIWRNLIHLSWESFLYALILMGSTLKCNVVWWTTYGEVDEENRETVKEIMLHWETAFQENLIAWKAILAVKKKKKGLALPLNSLNKASYPWDPSWVYFLLPLLLFMEKYFVKINIYLVIEFGCMVKCACTYDILKFCGVEKGMTISSQQ